MIDQREALDAVMSGREERASAQAGMLSGASGLFVCQVSLNIPGFPKRLEGDEALIEKLSRDFENRICCRQLAKVRLENGAGLAVLALFEGEREDALGAKLAAVAIEESGECGRVADIDVMTAAGPISRADLGLGPRTCLLCGRASKECARERRHSYEELRAKTLSFISAFLSRIE